MKPIMGGLYLHPLTIPMQWLSQQLQLLLCQPLVWQIPHQAHVIVMDVPYRIEAAPQQPAHVPHPIVDRA